MAPFLFLILFLSFTISPSSPSPLPSFDAVNYGPISTNGKNYSKVCDAARFADLRLNMSQFIYCDKSKPYDVRVKDLIGRMTLKEKAHQLGDLANGTERIGLPAYKWWSEALHGVSDAGRGTKFGDLVRGATSFPNVILLAASFNESLWKRIGQVTSTEARAMYNLGHAGLTFWSPNINVARDPRWGRILETPGEDPFLVGRYAVNFVRGMQDVEGHEIVQDPNTRPLKVSACCKHFAAYDLENWMGIVRRKFDARVTEQDMVETFMHPFEACVKEGDVSSVMCSFNRVNGYPVCADPNLMSGTFRHEYGLHGYIVADCDSLVVIDEYINWLNSRAVDTVARTMKAGLDLSCRYGKYDYYKHFLPRAVQDGKVRESEMDDALKNLYTVLMRAGYFDGIPAYESLGAKDVCKHEHTELALDAARQAIVLLKNNLTTLPLDPNKYKNVALIGPHVNSTKSLIGNYAGKPCKYVSPLKAISKDVTVDYQRGCADILCKKGDLIGSSVKSAMKASATILLVGLDLSMEAEERDRNDLLLPGYQTELIERVAEASAGPVVLVIISGGCVDVSFAKKNPKIGAILWAGYPGGEGGTPIADVIFGRYNPGGRLPLTWYKNDYVQQLPMTSMQLRPMRKLNYPGRTYKFFAGEVVYPFGYGLSYTEYKYSNISINSTRSFSFPVQPLYSCKPLNYKRRAAVPSCASVAVDHLPCNNVNITFEVAVSNVGEMDGEHVVLAYSKSPAEIDDAPLKKLVAYQRVFLEANGKPEVVQFNIGVCQAFGLVDKTAYTVVPSGTHTIVVGDGAQAVSHKVEIKFFKRN